MTLRIGFPEDAIIIGEGASTMDIGRTQMMNRLARHRLDAGTYGTMGVGLGFAIAAAVTNPGKPVVSVQGDSAFGFSGMEIETIVRYNLPIKLIVLNNGGIGGGIGPLEKGKTCATKHSHLWRTVRRNAGSSRWQRNVRLRSGRLEVGSG